MANVLVCCAGVKIKKIEKNSKTKRVDLSFAGGWYDGSYLLDESQQVSWHSGCCSAAKLRLERIFIKTDRLAV